MTNSPTPAPTEVEERLLVLAPRGRDAVITRDLLGQNGMAATICRSVQHLVEELREGAGAALVAEEALAAGETGPLVAWVGRQPPWSDFPFVVLSNGARGPRTARASAALEALGNIVLLDRPLHTEALVRAAKSALKARRRQYEVRGFAGALERSVAERTGELAAARESLEIALEAADMGSWDLDIASDSARRTLRHDEIFGYSTLQPRWGREILLAHVSPADRERVRAAMDKAMTTGKLDVECSIDAADGVTRSVGFKGRVHFDEQRRPVRMTGVVADISARKEADARLAQIQKMDTIGQLTGGVAHDFNNLLTPILGSLDLLRRHLRGDERAQKLIGSALQASERASTLTQRLLAFARRQTLEPQAVDVGVLIEGLVDLMRRTLGPTIEVTLDIPGRLPAARVDPNQLELALLNLAVNARDAMPEGGRLTISTAARTLAPDNAMGLAPGLFVRIVTADTGVGMDAATLERAIEPFFSTKGVGKGTGLGLSMVHGLAAQSGGTLRLTSAPGKGARVEMWLPATEQDSRPSRHAAADHHSAHRTGNVLLVDDEDLVRLATAEMLRDLGYSVVAKASGSQALAWLRSGGQADIVVSDYLMPGMTGARLARELGEAGVAIPLLLITGYANAAEDVPREVPRLSKPFRQADLAARVGELLERGGPIGRPAISRAGG